MYSSPGRLWQVLVGVTIVFVLGCQETRTMGPTLGNLPQQPPNTKEPEINASTYFAHAHLLERQGQFERAAQQYKRALALRPQFLSARNRLGITLNKLGRHAEATLQFEQALAGYPATAYLYNNLGFSLYLEGRYAEAEAALSQALQLKPEFKRAHMNRALALAELNRLDEAFTELKQVNNEPDAYFNMGVILIDAEQYDEAGNYFEAALALRPDFDAARQQLTEVSRLAAEAEARKAALALIAQANAEEEAASETMQEFPDETAITDEPQEPSDEVAVAEAPPPNDTSEQWETNENEEVAQGQEEYYEPVDPMPVEDETTDVVTDDTPETWETTNTGQIAQDDQNEFSEPTQTDVADSSNEFEPTPAENETTDVTADNTSETWETTETVAQNQEEYYESPDNDFADSSSNFEPMPVEEEPDVTFEQSIELPVAEATVEPGVWGDMDMVWLDYAGPEDAWGETSTSAWDEFDASQFPPDGEIDPNLLFAMINEAIADLNNQDSDSFDSLWCKIGYYLFPDTAPNQPETGVEQLADQTDYAETTADTPIGK